MRLRKRRNLILSRFQNFHFGPALRTSATPAVDSKNETCYGVVPPTILAFVAAAGSTTEPVTLS